MKIKPCPFCGCVELDFCRTNEVASWVECTFCGGQTQHAAKREDAIRLWNKRSKRNSNAKFIEDDDVNKESPCPE